MSRTKADILLELKELSDLLAQSQLDAVALHDDLATAEAERDALRARIDKVLSDAGLLSSEQIVDILEGNDVI